MALDKTPSMSRNRTSPTSGNVGYLKWGVLASTVSLMGVLFCHGPATAAEGLDNERRAYRLCLARAVTAVEDRFSPPGEVVKAIKPYCAKEEAALFVMAGGQGKDAAAAQEWAASYVVAVRSCLSGTCALLEAMQRDDLGL